MNESNAKQTTPSKRPKLTFWQSVAMVLFAWEPWRRPGSLARLVLSRLVFYTSFALIIEITWRLESGSNGTLAALAYLLSGFSIGFFVYAVVIVPLLSSASFHIDARRLFMNALLSAAFMILSFSHLYRLDGLSSDVPKTAIEYLYFSAVTFSTLGFGDFAPVSSAGRLTAALQALLGNLHLAILVGAIFLRMSRRQPPTIS